MSVRRTAVALRQGLTGCRWRLVFLLQKIRLLTGLVSGDGDRKTVHLNDRRLTLGGNTEATNALSDAERIPLAVERRLMAPLCASRAPLILSPTACNSSTLKLILSQRSPASFAISWAFGPKLIAPDRCDGACRHQEIERSS